MADAKKRVIQYPEKNTVGNTDYVLIDSSANGTNKYQVTRILTEAEAAAQTKVDAEAAAREAADNELKADLTNINGDLTTLDALYSLDRTATKNNVSYKYTEFPYSFKKGTIYKVSLSTSIPSPVDVPMATYAGSGYIDSNIATLKQGELNKTFVYVPSNDAEKMVVQSLTGGTFSFTLEIYLISVYTKPEVESFSKIAVTCYDGYYAWNAHIVAQTECKEKYTELIRCYEGMKLIFDMKFIESQHESWCAFIEFNDDGTFTRTPFINAIDKVESRYVYTPAQNAKTVSFMFRGYDDYELTISVASGVIEYINKDKFAYNQPFLEKPCYDHLFVNYGINAIIPHESLYHVRISKLMGFDVIEANVAKTSDGVFFVNHLKQGKFGDYFHHTDGTTDISNIYPTSVTWSWIVENVRYNSTIPKYRTRPCTLEEFLSECKQQNLIPLVGTGSDTEQILKIVNKYMGEGNYIAYGANRAQCPTAPIYHWESLASADEILAYCNGIGKPFIYGMANPNDFTAEELQEIVNMLHEHGYRVGTSYTDIEWYKYRYIGFDFNGTQQLMNRIVRGNICNFESMFGFNDFTYSNATESSGVLTFSDQGTITPNMGADSYELCAVDLQVWFIGTITIPAIGDYWGAIYTSDGTYPVFVSAPIINGTPKITITCSQGTIVKDIKYKASVL